VNLAFNLSNDKDLRDHILFESFNLVSLWDMLRIRAQDFIDACSALARVSTIIEQVKKTDPERKHSNPPPIKEDIERLRNAAGRMRLKVIVDRAEELIEFITENEEIELARLDNMVKALPNKLMKELKSELWLRVRPEHARIYDGKKALLSKQVLNDLPEIRQEEKRARRCYAFEKYTACAFHLMRIMELLVQRFGTILNVTFDPGETPWGNILESCRQEIEKWDKKHSNHIHKKQFATCHHLMEGLRPIRNDLMHYRQSYDEDAVQDLKGAVELSIKAFLKLPALT
jgi:hypothetical protein